MSGFGNVDVIDMDTIDVSNLNRQFLFRGEDVGKSKAETAARRTRERVPTCEVTAHHGRIEDKEDGWYRQFDIIALGLDSLEARAYINSVCCGFLEYDEDGNVDPTTIKPLVDGGTEGFKGHARVIVPGMTPCFHCTMWLFPPQTTFPLCTLAETPRSAAHCIEYAKLIQWPAERHGETFDPDIVEHMTWVYKKALKRAETFGIEGVTYSHTQHTGDSEYERHHRRGVRHRNAENSHDVRKRHEQLYDVRRYGRGIFAHGGVRARPHVCHVLARYRAQCERVRDTQRFHVVHCCSAS
jgi:NEDD8-activating enzyme E1